MRTRCVTTIAALLLASASMAGAQTPPTKPEPPANVPTRGLLDFGYRGGSVTGDEARFERYRDPRPGVATWFEVDKKSDSFRAKGDAFNVGYRDQNYSGYFTNGKLSLNGSFNSIPLNYIYDASLIWNGDGQGRFTRPTALRASVEGPTNAAGDGTAVGVPCAPGLGPTTCSAATAAQAIANRSIYNSIISPADIAVKRESFDVKVGYIGTPAFGVNVDFQSTGRTGAMPWNASYAFNNANQLPVPNDQRNNELKAGTVWVNAKGMVRLDDWGQLLQQCDPDADLGQPDSRHRLQQRPAASAWSVRP